VTALDPQSPLPLYHQLADRLLARIRAGEYPPGARIPSEPELARTFGIGRPTVRQATERLVREGRLERGRGSGTYVAPPRERVDLLSLAGTLASFQRRGIEVRPVLLEPVRRVRVEADPENPFAGRRAWHTSRLSRAQGAPVLLEDFFLDSDLFPGLDAVPLADGSLSRLVGERYRMRPESAEQSFRIERVDARRAGALALEPGEPVLLVKRTLHFAEARSAVFAELRCRTERFAFSQTLGAPNPGGPAGA